eukprot:3516858-Prymnesium_polylepis.1
MACCRRSAFGSPSVVHGSSNCSPWGQVVRHRAVPAVAVAQPLVGQAAVAPHEPPASRPRHEVAR